LIIRQLGEATEEIPMRDRGFLSSFKARQFLLRDSVELLMDATPRQARPLAAKTVIEDRIKPGACVLTCTALPVCQGSLESVLDEIVSALEVAAQQRSRKAPQTRNMHLDEVGSAGHCLPRWMTGAPQR